jgi:hypothetical protein
VLDQIVNNYDLADFSYVDPGVKRKSMLEKYTAAKIMEIDERHTPLAGASSNSKCN